jgi:hypothetical protein
MRQDSERTVYGPLKKISAILEPSRERCYTELVLASAGDAFGAFGDGSC